MAAPEKEGEAQKLRFGQWLLNAINSGSYRGLRWIDSAHTVFRVPWKHNARKDITSSDVEVFKAWAKVSGRYEEGSEDPAKWKTNFRCALRSTCLFKLEQDHSKHVDDPHKVFSIVSGEPRPMEGLCWMEWAISGPPIPGALFSATLRDTKEGDSGTPNPVVDQQAAQQQLQVAGWAQEARGGPCCHSTSIAPKLQPSTWPKYGIVSTLDVTIYYRGKEFYREVVGGSRCLLTYQHPSLPGAPCPWHVVHFPSPASLADGKQRRITERLLGIAGLQLEQRAYKVFATRREKCKVFWALSQQLEGVEEPPPNLLCRDQETPIFDFNEFCIELRDFRNGQRQRSPDFTIYLCFGQAFSRAKPKESKLILVKLVPKFCEYCYEQVLQEGASSLDSHTISLQLSNSFDLMELIEQYNMQLG
ncbi:unnamed protein product [Coccothraustes coccothraustes]